MKQKSPPEPRRASRASLLAQILGFTLAWTCAAAAADRVAAVKVDLSSTWRRSINPLIYGVGVGDATSIGSDDLKALNFTINRIGGNGLSTYNWRANAHNLGSDWFFESYPFGGTGRSAEINSFVATNKSAGLRSMVTVPMMGWVAKLGTGRQVLPAFSIEKYGAQTDHDYWYPDAGNGILSSGSAVSGNDPRDAYVPSSPTDQKGFIASLVAKFGPASSGGASYYLLDNEVSLWSSTHRDIHPEGVHAAEARDAMIRYAAAIRAADRSAKIVGPEEWGWSPFLYSGYDQQWLSDHGWVGEGPDHKGLQGGRDYMPWLLGQLKKAGRPIDVFSMHYYPQSGEYSDDVTADMQRRRNRSTRELWDASYVSQSWIGSKINLIARMRGLVDANYHPGTPIALTEYSWGADDAINGATAQADLLGIFGREGLDIATRWTAPVPSTPTFKAMQMFRNYDGNLKTFGETAVPVRVANSDALSAFAALRAGDKALTVIIVNKALSIDNPATKTAISLKGFTPSQQIQAFQLDAANVITRLATPTFTRTAVTVPTPAQSVTMVVIGAKGTPIAMPPFARLTASPLDSETSQPVAAEVSFDGSLSEAASGSVAGYHWDFGDGTTAEGQSVKHSFTAYGVNTVSLTVTDGRGLKGRATANVIVRPARQAQASCSASYQVTGDWGSSQTVNLHLTNTGSAPITDWALEWTFPGDQQISSLWNGALHRLADEELVTPADWNREIAAGASIDVGFYAAYSASNRAPTEFRLNGMTCVLN